MKYDGINYSYQYIHDDSELCFSDILTLQILIWKLSQKKLSYIGHERIIEGQKKYYTDLWNFILKWISSELVMDDFLYKDFVISGKGQRDFSMIYSWLLMLRESYLDIIFCFNWDLVWNRWKSVNAFACHEIIHEEIIYYKDSKDLYINHIKNIDIILSKNLSINLEKYITLNELKDNFWFNLNIPKIQDEYFQV